MSFAAALPQKSHVSLKWRALEKTLQAWNKPTANSHLRFSALDKVHVAILVLSPLDSFSFPLTTFLA